MLNRRLVSQSSKANKAGRREIGPGQSRSTSGEAEEKVLQKGHTAGAQGLRWRLTVCVMVHGDADVPCAERCRPLETSRLVRGKSVWFDSGLRLRGPVGHDCRGMQSGVRLRFWSDGVTAVQSRVLGLNRSRPRRQTGGARTGLHRRGSGSGTALRVCRRAYPSR